MGAKDLSTYPKASGLSEKPVSLEVQKNKKRYR
jgi:hypothetical protein